MKRVFLAIALLVAAPTLGNGLRPFVRGSWQKLRSSHRGQPLIVHFWGVSCAPCMADLPDWADLRKAPGDAAIVFVAADPEPVAQAAILDALTRSGLGAADCWMFADSFAERLRYEVNPGWGGELPYTVLITREGRVSTISGVAGPEKIRDWLNRQAQLR